jgi:L-iditol 2-dehydrogenase
MEDLVTLPVAYVGICGSDLQKAGPNTADYSSLGHEVVAMHGDKPVAINPLISCEECGECTAGRPMFCRKLLAIGRNMPGGFSGSVSVPSQNVLPLGAVDAKLGVLTDPYAVVLHGLKNIPDTDEVTILGDGIIGQLCLIYFLLHQSGATKCTLVTKDKQRSEAILKQYAHMFEERKKRLQSMDFETYQASKSSSELIIETIGRAQSSVLSQAVEHVTPRGQIVGFGVYPEGFNAALPIRQLLYKESTLRGVNSFEHEDFANALKQIQKAPEMFEILLGPVFGEGDISEAFRQAAEKTTDIPRKVIVKFEGAK